MSAQRQDRVEGGHWEQAPQSHRRRDCHARQGAGRPDWMRHLRDGQLRYHRLRRRDRRTGLAFHHVALKCAPGGDTWNGLHDLLRAGGDTWIAGTYDPELNPTYWGVAQAKPWMRASRGTANGAALYSSSTLALDPDTGKLKWYFQHAPGESLDLDEVFERVLIDHGAQKTLMTIGKAGILWKLDRSPASSSPTRRRCSRTSSPTSIPRPACHLSPGYRRPARPMSGSSHVPARRAAMTGRRRAMTSPTTC